MRNTPVSGAAAVVGRRLIVKVSGRQVKNRRYLEGFPIFDGAKNLTLTFTPADINTANQLDVKHCVLARSCQRMGIERIYVSNSTIYLFDSQKKAYVRYILNGSGIKLIKAFDEGSKEFDLNGIKLLAPIGQKVLGSDHIRKPGAGIKRTKRRAYILSPARRPRPTIRWYAEPTEEELPVKSHPKSADKRRKR